MPLRDAVLASQEYVQQIKAIGAGLPSIASEFGSGDIFAWIPSGIFVVDQMLGGGLPLGRMVELYSVEESEGKSTLAVHFAIMCQAQGGVVIWLESESALDKSRAQRMGLDLEKMVLWGPPDLESGFGFIKNIMANIREQEDLADVPVLIVWDTIAAAPLRTQKEGDEYAEGMTRKPRVIFDACRDLTLEFYKNKVCMLFVNQSITTMSRFGAGYTTPGGKGIKFHASIRIELHRKGQPLMDENDEPCGIVTELFVKKNKLALPGRRAQLVLYGETGFDDVGTMWEVLVNKEMKDFLRQAGGWWNSPDITTGELVKFRAADIDATVQAYPGVVAGWRKAVEKLWPLPPDRSRDDFSGWVFPKPPEEKGADGNPVKTAVLSPPIRDVSIDDILKGQGLVGEDGEEESEADADEVEDEPTDEEDETTE